MKARVPKLRLVLVAFGLAFLASGCDRKEPSPSSISRIAFLHYFSGSLSGGIDALVGIFNKENPDYELTAVPIDHESFKSSIGDTLKAGNPPDIYSYWAGAKTAAILADLEPIDDVWLGAGLDSVFPRSLTQSSSLYEGKHYLLPITQHAVGFFYNKGLFRKAGLQPPTDWTSFVAACATLKSIGAIPIALGSDQKWPAQFWFDYILLRTAGPDYRNRLMRGDTAWTDREVLRAFLLWRELIDAGFFNDDPNGVAWDSGAAMMVADGKAAMTLMGTWVMGVWNSYHIDWVEDRDYGFFPFPEIDAGVPICMVGPIDGLIIPRGAKNIPGAKRVLRFLAGAAPQEAMSRGAGALAPNTKVPDSAYTRTQLLVRDFIAASDEWAFAYDLATSPAVSDIGLTLFSDFIRFPDQTTELLQAAHARFDSAMEVIR